MPEGDTIHRTAGRLRPALAGRELVRFDAPRLVGSRPRAGETVREVDAVGKHLLIAFSGGLTLDTHMRMTGAWHLYATGERWRKPAYLMRALLVVDGWEAVCFSAPLVRTYPTLLVTERTDAGPAGGPLAHLGPDLCRADADLDECLERMARLDPSTSLAEVLLDQRVCNGVGNVYKSEVCWACRVSPFAPIGECAPAQRAALVSTAARLLRANLGPGSRTTVPGGLAVYGRRGSPCRRCGTAVRSMRHGEQARVTFWCPTCQPDLVPGSVAPLS